MDVSSSHFSQLNALFVESYPHALAGQQKTLMALLERASSAGISATVVTPGHGAYVEQLAKLGYETDVMRQPDSIGTYGGVVYGYGALKKLGMGFAVASYIFRLRRYIRARRFSVVYCNDMRGLLTFGVAARSIGVPVVIWDKLDKPHGILDWVQLPLASRNIIISRGVMTKYPEWQKKFFRKRIETVTNWVDLEKFRPRTDVVSGSENVTPALLVGFVGSLNHRKGFDRLIDFADVLREFDAQVLIAGEVPLGGADFSKEVFAKFDKAGLNYRYLGQVTDMPSFYKELDLLICPSRNEGMPGVVLEAMSSGVPVLGASIPGIEEALVDGRSGMIRNFENVDDVQTALRQLLSDAALRERLGLAAREKAERDFDINTQAEKIFLQLKLAVEG